MSISSGLASYRLNFAISPIILTGGVASNIAGGALPLLSLTPGFSIGNSGLLTTSSSSDDSWVYQPLPGGTLIDQQIGMYPFANQQTAANATIQQPLAISMILYCPANDSAGYISKGSILQALQASLYQHNTSGGLYTIMTNAFPYINCVMQTMTDVSTQETHQTQNRYKLDFIRPLVTLQQAAQAYNAEMGQIANNLPTSGSQFGPANLAGNTVGAQGPGAIQSTGIGGVLNPGSVGGYSPTVESATSTGGIP